MEVTSLTKKLRGGEPVLLRSPRLDEAAIVLDYIRALSRDAARNLNHPASFFESMKVEDERGFLEMVAQHPKNFLIAAFVNGEVVGTAGITQSAPTFSRHCAELGLGVLAPYRQQGVGRILMDAVIENATQLGVGNLLLHVRTFNAPAIALYESLGFRRVGILYRVAKLSDTEFADEYVYQREG